MKDPCPAPPLDGQANYYPEFFTAAESDFYFHKRLEEIDWKQEPVFLFGKSAMQLRLTAW
jgi:hypothetical protein